MNPQLSDRANDWLTTLPRQPAVSTESVCEVLIRNKTEPFESWLSFHERFAGYIEPIGVDIAHWGLMHENPHWLPPNDVVSDYDEVEKFWCIACADAHPTYEYQLDQHGVLHSAVTTCTFEVYIERRALQWWFCSQSANPKLTLNATAPSLVDRIETETKLVQEASDEHYLHRLGDRILAIREIANNRWVEVYTL